jgi:hypothetical protein
MSTFRYLETTVRNRNYIHAEINSRLNSVNAYYHSVQNAIYLHLTPIGLQRHLHSDELHNLRLFNKS